MEVLEQSSCRREAPNETDSTLQRSTLASQVVYLKCFFVKDLQSLIQDPYGGYVSALREDKEYDAILLDDLSRRQQFIDLEIAVVGSL